MKSNVAISSFFLQWLLVTALSLGYAHAQTGSGAGIPLKALIELEASGSQKSESELIDPATGSFADTLTNAGLGTASVQIQLIGPNHWQITQTVQGAARVDVFWGFSSTLTVTATSMASATLGSNSDPNLIIDEEALLYLDVAPATSFAGCAFLTPVVSQSVPPNCLGVTGTSGTWTFQGLGTPNLLGSTSGATATECISGLPPGSCSATLITDIQVGPASPKVSAVDLGCGSSSLPQCGKPINTTNGNTWVEQRDYSLPGLGGGLELMRTWNSLWQSVNPVSKAGMFGDSWSSTYEERLTFPDSYSIQYWRSGGSAWTFTLSSGTNSYLISSPPDERAEMQFNSITGQYTLTFADGTQRLFSQPGYLLALLDRNGNQTNVSYDGSNRITSVTDPAGRSITFTYGSSLSPSQATSVQDVVGAVATYTYDSGLHLTQVTYADGSGLDFAYDTNGLLLSVTDNLGKLIESHTYDSQRRGLTSTGAGNADSITLAYSTSGQTTLTDSLGLLTTYSFQNIVGRNFMTSIVGPGCSTCGGRGNQTLTYDILGNLTSSTDALGRATRFAYDANGNVLTRSIALNASTTLTWSYTYNQFQQVLTATDPLGNSTTNVYDAHGNLLSTTAPPPAAGQSGLTTRFAYDSKGELTQITDPRANTTALTYTPAGLIASKTDAQGNVTLFTYDARSNPISSTDARGKTTSFAYDAMNRLVRIIQPDGSTSSFAYDQRGRRTSATDANGRTTAFQYDDANRLVAVVDAAGNLTSYGYDTEDHLALITDALGRVTNYAYDALGRATRATFPSGLSESYTYDAVGNMLSKTDRKGQTISYAYDNLNRLLSKTYPDSTGVTYTYDALSGLTQATDPTGTYSFSYDDLGRLAETTTGYSFLARNLAMSYAYDADSNRVSFTDPEGGMTSYAYDSLNRLSSLTDFSGGSFSASYDVLGRPTSFMRPNGVDTSYQYDSVSRLLSVLHQTGAKTIDGAIYTYDPVGNRTSKTNLLPKLPAGDQPTTNYAYDAVYRLTQAAQAGFRTEAYSYDAVGNRLSSLGSPPYTYNSSNELTSEGKTVFTYDANGNTVSRSDPDGTTRYTWDFENRLVGVVLPNGHSQHYTYDPFGRRILRTWENQTRIFVYDGHNIVEGLDAGGRTVTRYTQGLTIDEPLATYSSGVGSYYEADGLGSITSLTNASGTTVNSYEYDSFGKLTGINETVSNAFRYTAHEDDGQTKLYYYRARYYDSGTGRFISEDPFRFSDGNTDLFAYVLNSPMNNVDPKGLSSESGSGVPFPPSSFVWPESDESSTSGSQYQNQIPEGFFVPTSFIMLGPYGSREFHCGGRSHRKRELTTWQKILNDEAIRMLNRDRYGPLPFGFVPLEPDLAPRPNANEF